MKGIIVLAHGSKRVESEETLNSLVSKVKDMTSEYIVVSAFLQFSSRNLKKAVSELVQKGISDIKVMPMFLFDGIHVTQDIPSEIKEVLKEFQGINITMTKHIGDDKKIAEIILDRVSG